MGMVSIRVDGPDEGYEIDGDLDTAFTEVRKLWAAGHNIVYIETPMIAFVCDKREPGLRAVVGLFKNA